MVSIFERKNSFRQRELLFGTENSGPDTPLGILYLYLLQIYLGLEKSLLLSCDFNNFQLTYVVRSRRCDQENRVFGATGQNSILCHLSVIREYIS